MGSLTALGFGSRPPEAPTCERTDLPGPLLPVGSAGSRASSLFPCSRTKILWAHYGIVKIVLGAVVLFLAIRQDRPRPDGDSSRQMPPWTFLTPLIGLRIGFVRALVDKRSQHRYGEN